MIASAPYARGSSPCPHSSSPCPHSSSPCPHSSSSCPHGSSACPYGSLPYPMVSNTTVPSPLHVSLMQWPGCSKSLPTTLSSMVCFRAHRGIPFIGVLRLKMMFNEPLLTLTSSEPWGKGWPSVTGASIRERLRVRLGQV